MPAEPDILSAQPKYFDSQAKLALDRVARCYLIGSEKLERHPIEEWDRRPLGRGTRPAETDAGQGAVQCYESY